MRGTLVVFAIALLLPGRAHADSVTAQIVQLGQEAADSWSKSCYRKDPLGLCVSFKHSKTRNRCSAVQTGIIFHTRSRTTARRALEKTRRLYELLAQNPDLEGQPAVEKARVQALAVEANAKFEELLHVTAPTGLDFSGPDKKRSERAFAGFLQKTKRLATVINQLYEQIRGSKNASPSTSVEAVARMGLVSQHFARLLYEIEVPRDVRKGRYAQDATEAFCDTVAEKAAPLEDMARNAFELCVNLDRQSASGKWARFCRKHMAPMGDASDRFAQRRIIRRHLDAIARCYRDEAARSPKLEGKVVLKMRLNPRGEVKQVKASGLGNRRVEDCMEAEVQQLRFPPSSRAVDIDYPLTFKPEP
jgi:hypothetical protein